MFLEKLTNTYLNRSNFSWRGLLSQLGPLLQAPLDVTAMSL